MNDFNHLGGVFTLRDFLASREAEIREQIKLLRAELAELKRAKAAIEQPENAADENVDSEVRDSGRVTIKDMVRSVFARSEAARGLAAGEVLEAIERSFNVKIERTSLSPQLSRLRDSGDVVLQDGRWFPAEPRLSQAPSVVAPASSALKTHWGGGDVITAGSIAEGAARMSVGSMLSPSATEEAMKIARASMLPRDAVAGANFSTRALSTIAAAEAAMKSGQYAAAAAALSSTPRTMRATEEAERKMRELLHGPNPHGVDKIWDSGPKTK